MSDTAQTLIAYCRENGRVCPRPDHWIAMYDLLPHGRRPDGGAEPSLPLILGGWSYSSNLDKMIRLADHINWAEQHGCLPTVSMFLRGLQEADWHHLRD